MSTTAPSRAATSITDDFRLPDGPKTPRLLNGLLFLFAQRRSVERTRRRYGDAYTVELPVIGRTVVVSHPELVRAVYTAKPTVLHAGKNPLGSLLGPGSLFSMDEDRHMEERRQLLPPFHGDRMRSYDQLIEDEALRAMGTWPEGTEFSTIATFQTITLRVILRAVFGAEDDALAGLERLLPPMTALGQRLVTAPVLRRDAGRWSPGRRYASMRRQYDELVGALVEQRLADPQLGERIDILATMLAGLRESDTNVNHSELADELLTLLVAGHETTASALAWTVERLRRHPQVLARLAQEVADGGSTLRTASILEVLRVRPVIGATGRMVMKPFQVGEWLLPPGTRVVTEISLTQRDERFHANADRFDPDRFVGRKPDTYAWIPFGGGVRRCVGAAFAQFEMDVVLRTMLRHFELQPTDAAGERESFRGVAFAPATGGIGVVRRRSEPLGTAAREVGEDAKCPVAHDAVPA